jgi:hypothetical protein
MRLILGRKRARRNAWAAQDGPGAKAWEGLSAPAAPSGRFWHFGLLEPFKEFHEACDGHIQQPGAAVKSPPALQWRDGEQEMRLFPGFFPGVFRQLIDISDHRGVLLAKGAFLHYRHVFGMTGRQ